MIPRIYRYNATDFDSNGEGLLVEGYDWSVYEEDNGDFTLTFKYPVAGRLVEFIKRGNIIKSDANKELKNQKFRIYSVEPSQSESNWTVKARHKSFDLNHDFIPANINILSGTCEYALNQIFKNSLESQGYKGYSDIVNTQQFTIGYVTPGEAIRGHEGSLADTFGNGLHILRDNSTEDAIHLLENRGKSSGVLLAYGKNITGFTGKEDDSDLITRLIPYATYTPQGEENNDQVTYRPQTFTYVDADNVSEYYGRAFTAELDCTQYLSEGQIPTDEFLKKKCEEYFKSNQCNYPKMSYEVNFQTLDATNLEGENLSALYNIGICDTLIIWHKLFNIRTEVKVSAVEYDPVQEEYIKIYLGDLRSTLSDLIKTPNDGKDGKDGQDGVDGNDGVTLYTWIKYADDENGNGLSGNPLEKKYIGLAYNKTTSEASENPEDYTWSLIQGKDGVPGPPGEDGTTYYTWIRYSDYANGNPNYDIPKDSTRYIGIAVNQLTETESDDSTLYKWSKFRGDDANDFPDTLPDVPVVSLKAGLSVIEITWSYENKAWYTYEVYASQIAEFTPTAFDLKYKGMASTYLLNVEPGQTWYVYVRAINSSGRATEFSQIKSITTPKINDASNYFEEAAIGDALIGNLRLDRGWVGQLSGTNIDARNLTVTDGNGATTLSVSSDGIVKLIQGLIDISDEGIRINLMDSEDTLVGYVIYDGQGVQVFTNTDEPISSFHREGAYTEKLVTTEIVCPPVVQVADLNGCPLNWYVAPNATGDGTGKDENNKANSLKDVLRNIKSYGYKFNNKITIHIESGCILNEDIVIQDFMGTVFSIELAENVVINCSKFVIEDMLCRIFIEYKSQNRLVAGNITQADYDKYPILNSENDSSCISIANTNYIEVRGIRIRGRESAYGVGAFAGSNLQIDDCDFSGVSQCICASGQSKVSLGWSSGRVEQLATLYGGSIFTSSRRIPKYTGDTMVEANENTIFIENTNGYTQFDTLYNTSSSTGGASAGSGTNLTDNFIIDKTMLYTMVEGEGNQTTARKGYTGQGKYKNLKAHRGYIQLPISTIKAVLQQKNKYEIKLRMTRLNTEHGYNSKTPHPILRAVGGSNGATEYWDSEIKFARGETQTIILPPMIVNAIENGATTLELWAESNQAQQYAFFGDIEIIIEGENKIIGESDKPSDAVGPGETAYVATGATTANLNVRTGAGTGYSIITTLPQGTSVSIVAKDDATGWYKISYNGAYGYLSNKYVTITSEGTSTDTSTIQDFPYADDLVETAMTYWRICDAEYTSGQSWSQGFTYRSSDTPLSGNCEAEQDVANSLWKTVTRSGQTRHYKAIDCSTLSGMATKGYAYADSPYASKTKFTVFRKDKLQKNDNVDWSFNMIKADGTWAREAASQCEYFDRIGAGIVYYRNVDTGETYGDKGTSANNYEPIKKGDLIFYAKKVNGDWKQPNRHMKVSHVAICYGNNSSGNKAVIEATNGTMTKNHTFDDGTSINAGVRIVSIAGSYGYADDIVMVVRPQPIHYDGTLPGGSTDTGGTGGDTIIDRGTTEYINCVSEQGTIDGNNYVYKLQKCKITAYGGDGSSACNIPLNLGKTCGSFNLPYGTKIYIPSMKGYKFTDGNGKTVTCDGIFTVNDTGVGCTDFDLYMSTYSDGNAENIFGNTRREDVYILSYGSGYGYAWSYTQSYAWAYNNGTLSAYKSAFKDYIKYNGTLINFLKFKTNDENIRNSTYWNILSN